MIQAVIADHPQFGFVAADTLRWSPSTQTIYYTKSDQSPHALVGLLHELGHATLGHEAFQSDIQLIQMERAAWECAQVLAKRYGIEIESEHIEDCLDTYRDWLKKRSTCPMCANVSLQTNPTTYQCFNCSSTWTVSRSQACRIQRTLKKLSNQVG